MAPQVKDDPVSIWRIALKKKYELRVKFYAKIFDKDVYTVEYCYYRFFKIWKKIYYWLPSFHEMYAVTTSLKKEEIENAKKQFNSIDTVKSFIKAEKEKEKAYIKEKKEKERLEKEKIKSFFRIL